MYDIIVVLGIWDHIILRLVEATTAGVPYSAGLGFMQPSKCRDVRA